MLRKFKTILLVLLLSVAAGGQQTGTPKGTANQDGLLLGKNLYVADCAVCHGNDARGGGPFSPQLKTWPPDLTVLAKKNNGVFPAMRLSEVIDGEFEKPAHGSREMPVWGPVFRSLAHGRNDSAQRRINRLVKYLESLQQK
jgi:mono/diheme cytochrome c family protein